MPHPKAAAAPSSFSGSYVDVVLTAVMKANSSGDGKVAMDGWHARFMLERHGLQVQCYCIFWYYVCHLKMCSMSFNVDDAYTFLKSRTKPRENIRRNMHGVILCMHVIFAVERGLCMRREDTTWHGDGAARPYMELSEYLISRSDMSEM